MRRVATGTASDLETRQRLLHVAEQLFADRGFKNVTVRDICASARANVAAINYHFGDKMGLYREVLASAIDQMRATTDAAREAGEGQSAEEKLRRFIKIFVHRVLTADTDTIHRLITREVHDPTPAIDTIVEEGIRPRLEYLSHVLGEMIGCPPTDLRVMRCLASIQSQSIAYRYNPIAERLGFSLDPMTPGQIDEVAEHIADFSIGGVRAIAREKA